MREEAVFQSAELSPEVVSNYLRYLVNRFFKILPIREAKDPSISAYLSALQRELLGCGNLIKYLNNDAQYISLLAKLQWMIDNPDYRFAEFRSEVFDAITICNKLRDRYAPDKEV